MSECKKACIEENDSWRKNNTRMGEKPSIRRVRFLVIFYKWLKILKCINIDTKVSYKEVVIVVVVIIVDFMLVFMRITIVIV
jgi:hypothetical protein